MKTRFLFLSVLALAGIASASTYTATVSGTTFTHEWALPIELSASDTLVVTVNGNSDQSAVDWTGITGTGTIRFAGTGILTLPNADYRFAETLSVAADVSLKLADSWRTTNGGYTITQFKTRDFRGSATLSRYTERSRCHLWTTQSTVTEWSGVLESSYEYGGTQYGVYLWVASDGAEPTREKALIVSGEQTSNQTLNIESSGCVILKGQWKGTINNNGLLIIAPGVDRTQFMVTGSGTTEVQQANEVIVIAPSDLKTMWEEEFASAYAEIHPGYTCSVVSTADIYANYPYAAANADGRPRNPAESIHAFIKEANLKYGNQYFILGGPWVGIDDLATNKVMKLATGETLGLTNAVPGIIACKRSQYGACESDLYYACLDGGNRYAWDCDEDGEYLEAESIADEAGRPRHATIPDVVVSRLPLVTWKKWQKEDGTLYTPRDLLKAYVAKLAKGLSADFDGVSSFASYGGNVYEADHGIYPKLDGSYKELVRRDESEFYTNVKNMFDPLRGNDAFWCSEPISRRHIKEQISPARPIDAVSALWEEAWSSSCATRDQAREAFYRNNHALRFYYSHGWSTGVSGSGCDDYTKAGCGLTLVDDCAGPCSTGAILFTDLTDGAYYEMNYALGTLLSPFGGSLATVNNTRAGFYSSDFRGTFDSGCSFELGSHLLEGFVCSNLTVGAAWKQMVARYARNRQANSTHVWIYSESMLQGDPLVKLPAVENGLAYADGVTYKGLVGKKDVVVSMNVDAATALETTEPLKVMNGLIVADSTLTLDTGAGGIGGEGVTFAGEEGTLTLAGHEPFYIAGVTNGRKVVVTGKGATLDFDSFDVSELVIGEGAEVTIRSNTRGALGKIGNTLTLPAGATVRLATGDAFGDTRGMITVGANAKLVVEPNPSYHDGNNRGESLNADIVFAEGVDTFEVAVSSEATFVGEKDPRVTYTEVPAYADELCYLNAATHWTASARGGMTDGDEGSSPIGPNTLVRFTSSYGIVYIHDDVRCSHISIENGANLQIGYWDNTWTVPTEWTVDIAKGSTLTIARWDNDTAGVVKIGDDVALDGEGVVDFTETVTSVTCGNLSGSATIRLRPRFTIISSGKITNPFVVPEGYRLKTTTAGGVTTYVAEDQRAVAFGKTWTYFYTGAGDDLAQASNWSTLSDGNFAAMSKAPLLTGSELWEPALFDGAKMALEAGADGYKHVTSSKKVEGWALKIGLTNGVCLTIGELEKLQVSGSATQYADIDATSKLVVKKFNWGKNCVMPFAIAAEGGLVWEADSSATGNTFVYSFTGDGSAKFLGTSNVATHQIASAEIALGEGAGKTILSKKLIAFNSEKANTSDCRFAAGATVRCDDAGVVATIKDTAVTANDAVGTCSLRKEEDGLYLDYVAREKVIERHAFSVGKDGVQDGNFYFDGKPFLIRCAEMHYGRIPAAYWRDRVRKAKAAGFNAVCAYMFWNNHEPVPGHFRFDGEQDVRRFCEIAQEEGMWVVLRPGPYVCAEWEFGGYPWWLLSSKMSEDGTINIRTKDDDYRQYTDRYLQQVGEQLADMQVTRGGNIIMIQVENEYGTYGNDTDYMKMEYDAIVNAGFTEIPKFTCNPTFRNGVANARIPELFYVVNGSGDFFDGENRIQKLIDSRLEGWENAPLMVGEYYTAWYDSWGGRHQTKAASAITADLASFIEHNVSFSVYMVHGGTSFGWWGGFNTPFVPMTTSYEYDAPISETGHCTEKFYAIKELLDQHLNDGETVAEVPGEVGLQSGTIAATPTYASLWDAPTYTKEITEPTDAPLTFENADLGYGYAIYETTLAAGQGGKLMADCRDLGIVRVDGKQVGYLDRRATWGWVEIPVADHPRKLEILVEALGRNHYDAFNDASKGLRGKPTLDKVPLSGWTMKTFDFLKWDEAKGAYASEMDNLEFAADAAPSARSGSFYKYNVTLDPTKDALLDMRTWRRGMVSVNGIWVGRYWTIGPQQTLYIPACWLKEGENANEIIILDTVGVAPQNELTFSPTHIISENRSDLDYYTPPELDELPKSLEALWGEAVKTGNLANNRTLQTVNFDAPATGRYFAFKATSAHNGQYAACAEFNLLDAAGQSIDRSNWTIVSCSSQEQRGEDAQIEKMLDGDNSTIWHSEWKVVQSTLPQYFVIDLGEEKTVSGFTWLGRQSGDAGFVNAYAVYVTNTDPVIDPETGITVSTGTLEEPFIIPASDINNVPVLIKSGAVLKVNATGNCKLTISGEGKDSVLIVGGGDYGFAEGSVFRNLTIQVDPGCNIWFETRESNPYDESVNVVVPTGATATLNNDGKFGKVITIGSLTVDGGTVVVWKTSNTSMNVTDTLYLREGATQPAGVTLAPGAKIEYLKLALVLDPSGFKDDGSEKALDWETLASAKFVGVADSSSLSLSEIESVTIRDSVNLGIRPALKGLKLIVDNNATVRFPMSGNGMTYCLEGVDVDVKAGSSVKITRAWGTGWTKGNDNTFNLKDACIHGEGTAIVPSAVTIALDNSSIELPFAAVDRTKVTLPDGLAFDAQGYIVPAKTPVNFDDPETISEATTATDLGLTNAAFASDDGATLKKVAAWALDTGTTLDALNAVGEKIADEAYLLAVEPTDEAVRKAKAAFRFDEVVPGRPPAIDASAYNGTVTIWGATTLKDGGDWRTDHASPVFFKAVLTR